MLLRASSKTASVAVTGKLFAVRKQIPLNNFGHSLSDKSTCLRQENRLSIVSRDLFTVGVLVWCVKYGGVAQRRARTRLVKTLLVLWWASCGERIVGKVQPFNHPLKLSWT